MSQHLLTCECGKQHIVTPAQAGEAVKCACGATVEVPSVRKLVHLPKAEVASAPAEKPWGIRSAVIFFGIYLLILCVLIGVMAQFFRQGPVELSKRTLWQNWQVWHMVAYGIKSPEADVILQRETPLILQAFQRNELVASWTNTAIKVAVLAIVVTVIGLCIPKPKRKPADKGS